MKLFIITISILIYGCEKCPKLELKLFEKNWVDHFIKGQKAYFKNANSQTDTIEITEVRDFFTPCNSLELTEYQFEVYDVSFIMKSISNYNKTEPLIAFETATYKSRVPHIYFGNLVPYTKESRNKLPVELDTTLNGVKFKSVYFYTKGVNMEENGNIEYFQNFFWSKELGLVAYTTSNGDLFVQFSQ